MQSRRNKPSFDEDQSEQKNELSKTGAVNRKQSGFMCCTARSIKWRKVFNDFWNKIENLSAVTKVEKKTSSILSEMIEQISRDKKKNWKGGARTPVLNKKTNEVRV